MKRTCAGCGCIGEHGVRVQTCGRSDCCCTNAPVRTQDPSETEATLATGSLAKPPAAAPPPALSAGLDRTFKIGLLLKAADGILEIIGGLLLLLLSPAQIDHIVRTLTAHELAQDPHDLIARHLLHTASHLTTATTLFGAIYLLSHGISKLVLVVLVLRNHLWAYPWLMALLLAFIGYQLYRLTVHMSIGLIALTIFDALLVWLTWREYRAKRATRREHTTVESDLPAGVAGLRR
jgi:uncharacterized membrane protein